MKKHHYLVTFLYILLFLSTLNLLKIFLSPSYIDFKYYYLALQTFIHGGNPYARSFFAFPYPPVALLFILPFSYLPLLIAGKIFVFISFIALILSISLLLRLFKVSLLSPLGMVVFILAFNFFPTKFSLASGQLNTIVLLLTCGFLYSFKMKRNYFAGMLLAMATALKLYPFLVIPYLLIQKKWKMLIALIATYLILSIIVLVFIPLPIISTYFSKILPQYLHVGGGGGYYDQSFSAFIARTFSKTNAALISHFVGGLIIIITILLTLYKRSKVSPLLIICLILIFNVIFSNFAWQHHFIWLLMPLIIVLLKGLKSNINLSFYIFLGISYLLLAINFKNPSTIPVLLQSHELYGALLLYILTLYIIIYSAKSKTNT